MPTFPELVAAELARATAAYGPIASLHEGYAIVLEELDEVWEIVKMSPRERNYPLNRKALLAELVQLAAMAQRMAQDGRLVVEGDA